MKEGNRFLIENSRESYFHITEISGWGESLSSAAEANTMPEKTIAPQVPVSLQGVVPGRRFHPRAGRLAAYDRVSP